MKVYHGSNVIVKEPKIVNRRRHLDFGRGFYVTLNKEQAIEFAIKVAKNRGGNPILNVYDFDIDGSFNLCTKIFESANDEWLDFVVENRSGTYNGPLYDLIYGPVANDKVYKTITLYKLNKLGKEETLKSLKLNILYNQYTFKSELSLGLLIFDNYIKIEV